MALVLAVSSLKGGVGKTTLTINIACALHQAGHRTLIVDADSQASCLRWAARAAEAGHQGPPVVALAGASLRRDLASVSSGFDAVVIDSPPRLGTEARAAMLAADLVLLPTTPGAADVWALRETLAVLEDARGLRPELRAVAVLNRADRTALAKMTADALVELGVTVLPVSLGARVAVGEATLAGLGVVTYAPGSPSAREVQALTRAVLEAVAGAAKEGSNDGRQEHQGEGQGGAGGRVRSRRAPAPGPAEDTARRAERGTVRTPRAGKPSAPSAPSATPRPGGKPRAGAPGTSTSRPAPGTPAKPRGKAPGKPGK